MIVHNTMEDQLIKTHQITGMEMEPPLTMMETCSVSIATSLRSDFQSPIMTSGQWSDGSCSETSSDGDFQSGNNAEFDSQYFQTPYACSTATQLTPMTSVSNDHYNDNHMYGNNIYHDNNYNYFPNANLNINRETDNIPLCTESSPDFYQDEDSVELPLQCSNSFSQPSPQQTHHCMSQPGYDYSNYGHHTPPNPVSALPHFPCFIDKKSAPTKRGRPKTFNKYGHEYTEISRALNSDDDEKASVSSRCKRGAKNILLWKFLLDELRKSQGHIKWENESEGTFKFIDTTECSRRWGLMKKKNDMNFEKLSRGIRHYYKDGLMSRMDVRLVYKFNWQCVPQQYWPGVLYRRR